MKIFKEDYLARDEGIMSVKLELGVLSTLRHTNIVKMMTHGSDGVIQKPSGQVIKNLVYIIFEYVKRSFSMVSGIGEDASRYLFNQLLNVLD